MARRIIIYVVLSMLAGLGSPFHVFAHDGDSAFIRGLIESDLVFEGRVVDVNYALSTPGTGQRVGLAHTFVTFQVTRIFKGRIDGPSIRDDDSPRPDSLTLRFMGGPEGDDNYLMVWGTPLFDRDDLDLLMVEDNGRSACPLVGCEHGRYRMIDRFVYNNQGHEIVSTDEALVRYGKFHAIPAVLVNQVGPVEIGRGGETEIDESGLPRVLPPFGSHYDAESFRAVVADKLRDLDAAGLLPPTDPVRSQHSGDDFRVDPAPPVARLPRVQPEPPPPASGVLTADRLEEVFSRDNDDDPVLDPRTAAFLSDFLERELRRRGRQEIKADLRQQRNETRGRP